MKNKIPQYFNLNFLVDLHKFANLDANYTVTRYPITVKIPEPIRMSPTIQAYLQISQNKRVEFALDYQIKDFFK